MSSRESSERPEQRTSKTLIDQGRWRQVWVLYAREMRAAMRERAIVVNSILLPIFLYPLILWIAFTAVAFVQGQTSRTTSLFAVNTWPGEHPGLQRMFELRQDLKIEPESIDEEAARVRLRDGRLDAYASFSANTTSPEVLLLFNRARSSSGETERIVREVVESYRQKWLRREALRRGAASADWQQFAVITRNIASGKQVGAFILGLMAPVLFVVMVAMGCFHPAVDATAGERERQTWETLMSTAANRTNIVVAKYLYVASLGTLAGTLNLAAVAATAKPVFAPLLSRTGTALEFTIPLAAAPFLILSAVLLAGFIAAGMMLFAAFARTFKEGQAMITPFYLVVLLPIMFLQTPGLKFTPLLALVPVVNVTLLARAAVMGAPPILEAVITLLVSGALIAACLKFASFVVQFEDVMLGSYNGSFLRFLKDWVFRRNSPTHPPRPTET